MSANFNLERQLAEDVEAIVRYLARTAMFHPKQAAFMARYALASRRATALRHEAEERGEHIPPFLIASITSACNLHCAGCYARGLHTCTDEAEVENPEGFQVREADCHGSNQKFEARHRVDQLSAPEWERIFREAKELGVGFILLAGGEPLIRPDVLDAAAKFPEILFPVFTNGTLLFGDMLDRFDRRRNLIPVLSIEGGAERTDARRGEGMYRQLRKVMSRLKAQNIAFGASITVTRENLREVTSDAFLGELSESGCKAVIFVEFVPTDESMKDLAPGDAERAAMTERLNELREGNSAMLLISFPGDELRTDGCLAAGRGFFHINPQGGAEPCPFSPYSDANLRNMHLKDALNSPLFRTLRAGGLLSGTHDGGCVLFEHRHEVEAILHNQKEN